MQQLAAARSELASVVAAKEAAELRAGEAEAALQVAAGVARFADENNKKARDALAGAQREVLALSERFKQQVSHCSAKQCTPFNTVCSHARQVDRSTRVFGWL